MKIIKFSWFLLSLFFIVSCSSDDDLEVDSVDDDIVIDNPNQDVQEFIWQGMNNIYFYKNDVPDLADNRFNSLEEFYSFLNTFDSTQSLFDDLQSSRDRFSFLVSDYVALEQTFSGVSLTTGMDFGLTLASQNSNDVLGFVRYILPGTDAENKGVIRGQFFSSIDGEQLTRNSDFNELFSRNSIDVGFVTIENGVITPDQTITLLQSENTENPVLVSKSIDFEGQRIGYLMYNSFTADFDQQLNNAFGELKDDNITDLILDLRYNGGGSVRSAVRLASMITGQFPNEIFSREIWNDFYQDFFSSEEQGGGERLLNRFVSDIAVTDQNSNTVDSIPINSLNLNRVYILTTDATASASELIINGLDPYIEVIQIGENTVGKFQASITLYDSDNFSRTGPNLDPNHTYAMQPLVLASANRDGISEFDDGLIADVPFSENIFNLGILGETSDPFLETALNFIVNGSVLSAKSPTIDYNIFGERKMFNPTYQKMYIDATDKNLRRDR